MELLRNAVSSASCGLEVNQRGHRREETAVVTVHKIHCPRDDRGDGRGQGFLQIAAGKRRRRRSFPSAVRINTIRAGEQ